MSFASRISLPGASAAPGAGALLLTVLFFLAVPLLQAEEALVARDGTLVFQAPDEQSAVLDILPRGTRINLEEISGQWCKVSMSDPARQGFIRKEALQIGPAVSEAEAPLPDFGSETYQYLQKQLNQTELKLRQTAARLDDLEKILEKLNQTAEMAGGRKKGMGEVTRRPADLGKIDFSVGLFSGIIYEGKDLSAGLSIIWRPGYLGPFSLEAEGGLILQQSAEDLRYGNLGLLCPLWKYHGWLSSYLAAGGGVIVRDLPGASLAGNDINPSANLGLGALTGIMGGLDLRADLRAVAEFRENETKYTGRFYLGLQYSL